MLGTIRDTLISVQNELSSGVEKIRLNVAPATAQQQKCVDEAIEEIVKTTAGSDLLLKFQMSVEQLRSVGEEGGRLANLCSTRMGRAQQMCKERADAVMAIDSFLRNSSDMEKRIRDLNTQVDKLERFCKQTEQALTHLEALDKVSVTEQEVRQIRQQSRVASTIINMDAPSVLTASVPRAGDAARERQEEVMLEEFLTNNK